MDDVEQALQDKMTIYGRSFALEVDKPSPPPWTGADGAETASSEYSLDLKTNLLLDGASWEWWRELLVGLGNELLPKAGVTRMRLRKPPSLTLPASLFILNLTSL